MSRQRDRITRIEAKNAMLQRERLFGVSALSLQSVAEVLTRMALQ